MGNIYAFYLYLSVPGLQNCHGYILVKAAFSAAPRIEEEMSVPSFLQIFVGMTEYDHIHTGQISGDLFFVMHHIEGNTVQLKPKGYRYLFRPFFVIISSDNVERFIF